MIHNMRHGVFGHLRDLADEYLKNKHNLVGIEIGSYAGESAEILLGTGAFTQFYCIDPWEMNYDPKDSTGDACLLEAERVFDSKFANNPVVVKLKMKSSDAVTTFQDGTIDFIYIDGNHQYDFVKKDLEDYVPKIKVGGIIAGHDYGGPTTPGVTRAVDEYFGVPPVNRYRDYSWVYIKQ